MPVTDRQYAASAWLHRYLSDKYDLSLTVGITVQPHRQIVPTQCPGTLDLARIVREAEGEDMTREEVIELLEERYGLTNTISAIKARLEVDANHTHKTGKPDAV